MKATPSSDYETFSMKATADFLEADHKSARSIYMDQYQRGWNAASKGDQPETMTDAEWDGYDAYLEQCGEWAS